MRSQPKSAHPHNRRNPDTVLENPFELRPWQGLRGSEYFELITSVEHCVRRDIERERPLTLDPKAIMDYLHRMATVA